MVKVMTHEDELRVQAGTAARRLPTWLVSAAHARRVVVDGREQRVPFATHHARQIGATTTACGMLAINWVNFYSSAFEPAEPGACSRCATALGLVTFAAEQQPMDLRLRDSWL
jgi:hypothetical protein